MVSNAWEQDPSANLDYTVNWSSWLGVDTIATSTWVVEDGLEKTDESNTTTTATVWLAGGTKGVTYRATNHIITAAGREDERTIYITVEEQ